VFDTESKHGPAEPKLWTIDQRFRIDAMCKGDALVETQIISLTAQVVSGYVANNDLSTTLLPGLIRVVYQALVAVIHAPAETTKAVPAVNPKKSAFADHILCLDCGQSFKMLKRHLRADHQMTPDEYRVKWGLPASYPMIASEYAATRSKMAIASGLGRKVEAPPPKRVSKKSGLGRKVGAAPAPKQRGRPKAS
jgi:predicted transcriptional regulator